MVIHIGIIHFLYRSLPGDSKVPNANNADDNKSTSNLNSDQVISTNSNMSESKIDVDVRPRRGRRKRDHEPSTRLLKDYHNHIDDVTDSSKKVEMSSTSNNNTSHTKRRKNRYSNDVGRHRKGFI